MSIPLCERIHHHWLGLGLEILLSLGGAADLAALSLYC